VLLCVAYPIIRPTLPLNLLSPLLLHRKTYFPIIIVDSSLLPYSLLIERVRVGRKIGYVTSLVRTMPSAWMFQTCPKGQIRFCTRILHFDEK